MENTNESFDTQSQDVEKTTENNQSSNVITLNGRQYTENDIIALQKKEEHWKKKFNKIKEEATDETSGQIDTTKTVAQPQSQTNDKRVDVLYFKQLHPELEISDIEEIIDISEAKRVSLEDAFKMPLIQNNLEYKKINKQNINATPDNNRSAKSLPNDKLEEIGKITDPEAHRKAVLGM